MKQKTNFLNSKDYGFERHFSTVTLNARGQRRSASGDLRERMGDLRILYSPKISLGYKGQS